jgi:hypothetical protein
VVIFTEILGQYSDPIFKGQESKKKMITTGCHVISQKSTDLINFVAEDSNLYHLFVLPLAETVFVMWFVWTT